MESRRNWILYMAHRLGKIPVKEIYNKLTPHVSRVTVNNDFLALEEQGLIKRERENPGNRNSTSYVIPLFDDSGEEEPSEIQERKEFYLNFGLPILNAVLIVILIVIAMAK